MTTAFRSDLWLGGALVLSVLTHGAAVIGLSRIPEERTIHTRVPTRIEFTVHRPEPAPPPPDVEAAPPLSPPPRAVAQRKRKPAPTPTEAVPTLAPTPSPSEALEPLAGETLAVPNAAAGFATVVGSGAGFSGPVGAIASIPAASPAAAVLPARVSTPPAVVAAKDLAERPVAPSLDAALRRNYPPSLKNKGVSGTARVRARIDADGVLRQATVLDESNAGFGEACRRTVTGSRWSPPLDQRGRRVATEIRYTCRFVVEG